MDRFAKDSEKILQATRPEHERQKSVASHRDCPEIFLWEPRKRAVFMRLCHQTFVGATERSPQFMRARNIRLEYRQASEEWDWEQNAGWMWRLWS